MKNIIVAYDRVGTIGRDGMLPWQGQLPADMRHFAEKTIGNTVIMGRKTFESLPEKYRPLPDRENIVLSMSATAIQGVKIAHSLDEAYEMASYEPYVIGGAQIYEEAMPTAERIYATEIQARVEKGDAFFPPILGCDWDLTAEEHYVADARNAYNYSFLTYVRRYQEF